MSPSEENVTAELMTFVRTRFLDGDPGGELEETSPLLEWGVLDSINSAVLLTFLNERWGDDVDLETIAARDFATVRGIAAMICARSAYPRSATSRSSSATS
ncbi:acyl carrier protein [Nonomuraea sp. NN258]|uniref:acyl carrier protein n=1 Tax=Nonomuraea antri TaxID=2730852 RepID=UPI001569BC9B|nr:acyl carrier protein [Nonomuraea antri]NRQ31669.1 acyl carrier protein [Nonomuraea antri]